MKETQKSWMRTLTTPVGELLGLTRRRRRWKEVVADAGLPAETGAVISQVVKKARLWRYEATDVAEEMVAHFHDGLAQGRTIDELIKSFGDAAAAAKLIRRAKMRNRPMAWRAAKRCVQAVALLIAAYILAALALTAQSPTVSVDYAAAMSDPVNNAPRELCGWPI